MAGGVVVVGWQHNITIISETGGLLTMVVVKVVFCCTRHGKNYFSFPFFCCCLEITHTTATAATISVFWLGNKSVSVGGLEW